jgi:hypothetical protein
MAAVLLDEGLTQRLARVYGNSAGFTPTKLRLYTAISPALSKSTVYANFTQVTPGTMGYAEKTVSGADWSFSLDTTNHWVIGSASYAWTFTAGAGLTILGWYLVYDTGTKAHLAEQFSSAVVIPAGGGSLTLTINDTYQACA